MPKAAVDEDDEAFATKYEVRLSGEILVPSPAPDFVLTEELD